MLVFIETESQLLQVINEYTDIQIVVVTPGADHAADKHGIKVISVEDFCNEADLLPISEEMIDRVEALSEYVDRKARYFIKYRYAKKILSLRAFFHFIKQNLDSFVIRIEQVLRTIEALSKLSTDKAIL